MRRRRRHLEVSTFPFLAVLLCTMGSLILLLLVLDRRAKIVAQRKVQSDYAFVQAERDRLDQELLREQVETDRLAQDRQAEWEQRRLQLHDMLAQEEENLLGQIQQTRDQMTTAAKKLESEKARADQQKSQLQIVTTRLAGLKQAVISQQEVAVRAAEQTESARRELERQASTLQQLEQTLANLKAFRERQKNTYSLVPYLGRRGDNRRPIYVECAGAAVIFHPERVALEGAQFTGEKMRDEVARRVARHLEQTQVPAGQEPPRPYLLMLIRPDGIRAYYRTQEALAGLNIDFGYEFVEQNWVLDFSAPDSDKAAQPWMAAGKLPNSSPTSSTSPDRPAPAGGGSTGLVGGSSGAGGPGQPGRGRLAVGLSPPRGPRDSSTGESGGGPGGVPGLPQFGSAGGGPARPAGFGPGGGTAQGMPNGLPPLSPGNAATGIPGGASVSKDVDRVGSGGSRPGGAGLGAGSSPGMPNGQPPLSSGSASTGVPPGPNAPKDAGDGTNDGTARQGGSVPNGGASPVVPGGATSSPGSGSPGVPASPNAPKDSAPVGSGGASVPGSFVASPSPPGLVGKDAKETANSGESSGGAGLSFGGPLAGGGGKAAPAPASLGRILGNRDWPIYLECNADSVILKQGNLKFTLEALSAPARGEHPLVQAVREIVNRRQATVRAGEPPYRPMLRFQVKPDGMRTYYLAYPLLEVLRLPMARENVSKQ